MGKIDVWDLDNSIARYIFNGLKQYMKANEKATFPSAPNYDFFENLTENASLEERVNAWHEYLTTIADKFKIIADSYKASQEEIDIAFDELKGIYKFLWI